MQQETKEAGPEFTRRQRARQWVQLVADAVVPGVRSSHTPQDMTHSCDQLNCYNIIYLNPMMPPPIKSNRRVTQRQPVERRRHCWSKHVELPEPDPSPAAQLI